VIEFQATDAYSILERTRVLYKTKSLSRVEKEDVIIIIIIIIAYGREESK
jgi:hypothetical protein